MRPLDALRGRNGAGPMRRKVVRKHRLPNTEKAIGRPTLSMSWRGSRNKYFKINFLK